MESLDFKRREILGEIERVGSAYICEIRRFDKQRQLEKILNEYECFLRQISLKVKEHEKITQQYMIDTQVRLDQLKKELMEYLVGTEIDITPIVDAILKQLEKPDSDLYEKIKELVDQIAKQEIDADTIINAVLEQINTETLKEEIINQINFDLDTFKQSMTKKIEDLQDEMQSFKNSVETSISSMNRRVTSVTERIGVLENRFDTIVDEVADRVANSFTTSGVQEGTLTQYCERNVVTPVVVQFKTPFAKIPTVEKVFVNQYCSATITNVTQIGFVVSLSCSNQSRDVQFTWKAYIPE